MQQSPSLRAVWFCFVFLKSIRCIFPISFKMEMRPVTLLGWTCNFMCPGSWHNGNAHSIEGWVYPKFTSQLQEKRQQLKSIWRWQLLIFFSMGGWIGLDSLPKIPQLIGLCLNCQHPQGTCQVRATSRTCTFRSDAFGGSKSFSLGGENGWCALCAQHIFDP